MKFTITAKELSISFDDSDNNDSVNALINNIIKHIDCSSNNASASSKKSSNADKKRDDNNDFDELEQKIEEQHNKSKENHNGDNTEAGNKECGYSK